jgi:hypothetical protein
MASIGGRALTSSKICAGLAQVLVGLPQLAVLAFERFHAFAIIGGRAGSTTLIALGLAHPKPKRLGLAADLGRNRGYGRPFGRVFGTVLLHHPHGALTHLGRMSR